MTLSGHSLDVSYIITAIVLSNSLSLRYHMAYLSMCTHSENEKSSLSKEPHHKARLYWLEISAFNAVMKNTCDIISSSMLRAFYGNDRVCVYNPMNNRIRTRAFKHQLNCLEDQVVVRRFWSQRAKDSHGINYMCCVI